ncbi:MAG: rhomboid family intramembrane serine protease [Marinifilaceae bacterium]
MNLNNPYGNYSNRSFLDGIKESFRQGSTLTKLIYINLGVFLLVKVLGVFYFLMGADPSGSFSLIQWLSVPADFNALLHKPWTIFTYMFLHQGFLHILFNMLWLYWFGIIFLSYLDQKKLLSIYILGGLTGAAIFMFAFNLFPVFEEAREYSIALGASASVWAVTIAAVTYAPNHIMHLMFIGPVRIKYIALFFLALDIISIPSGNAGGHIAHLGGAFYGWLYVNQLQQGKDIASGFVALMDSFFSLFKKRSHMKVKYKSTNRMSDKDYNKKKKNEQDQMNEILDKISKSGYDSLTKDEKEILFRSSNKH